MIKFKVELNMNCRTFTTVIFADTLEQLFNKIADDFPKAEIMSIVGGGQ